MLDASADPLNGILYCMFNWGDFLGSWTLLILLCSPIILFGISIVSMRKKRSAWNIIGTIFFGIISLLVILGGAFVLMSGPIILG